MDINRHKSRLNAYKINDESNVDGIKQAILRTFYSNPGYEEIEYNGNTYGVHMLDDGDIRRIGRKWMLTKPDDLTLNVGELFKWNGFNWIVTTKDRNDKIQNRLLVMLCNTTINLHIGSERVKIGEDHLGRPVYEETPQYNNTLCFAEAELSINRGTESQDVINLPEGRLRICIPYKEDHGVIQGKQFEIYNQTYEIKDSNFTHVVDDVGVIYFIAHRIQN